MIAKGQLEDSKVGFHTMIVQLFMDILLKVLLMGRNGKKLYSHTFGKAVQAKPLMKILKQTFNDESVSEMLEDTLKEKGVNVSNMIKQALKKESLLKWLEELLVVNKMLWQAINDSLLKVLQDTLHKKEVNKMLTQLFNDNKWLEMVKQALRVYITHSHTNVEEATNQNNVNEKISCIVIKLSANTANCKFKIDERQRVNIYNPFKIESLVWKGFYNTGSISYFQGKCVFFIPTLTENYMTVVKSILHQHQVYLYIEMHKKELNQGENCSLVVAFEDENNNTKRKLTLQLNVVTSDMFESAMNNAQMQSIVLTYSNIFPSDCRMFIALPVYKDGFINRKDQINNI